LRREPEGGRNIGRLRFLKIAAGAVGAAGLLAACGTIPGPGEGGGEGSGGTTAGSAAGEGRLLARPKAKPSGRITPGLQRLGLGSDRDGLLYVPEGYEAGRETPLAITLHGAGGDGRSGISHFIDLADEFGVVLLAPASRGRSWDVLVGGLGPDVEFIDRALQHTFERVNVDASRLAITGFSDGASYALSLGLPNGDFFSHVVGFSPGFMAPPSRSGEPPVFVSHGTRDNVLPIGATSRRIVPQLEEMGYEVLYREFDGPHTVPEPIAREALEWFTGN
jgi:phospholipase/carboxylesterase